MMGFFSKKQLDKARVDPCDACKLFKYCHTPNIPTIGIGNKSVLIVGSGVDRLEDDIGLSLQSAPNILSDSGLVLQNLLKEQNIDLFCDCYYCKAVSCYTAKTINTKTIKICHDKLHNKILKLKPTHIILLGDIALKVFYSTSASISVYRKTKIPNSKHSCWVLPLNDLDSYCDSNDNNYKASWELDFKWAVSCLNSSISAPIIKDYIHDIKLLYNYQEVISYLDYVLIDKPLIAVDYETSHLNTFKPGFKIWSVGINNIAFPLEYTGHFTKLEIRNIKKRIKSILLNPDINKVAHSASYEYAASRNFFNIESVPNLSCTMIAAHILDSRQRWCGLKHLSKIYFDVNGYGDEAKRFMQIHHSDGSNTLDQMLLSDLLKYNALDSYYTYLIHNKQQQVLRTRRNKKLKIANDFFQEGDRAFSEASFVGVPANFTYYKEQDKQLEIRIEDITNKIKNSDESKLFKSKTGREIELKKDFSQKDLRILFFDIMKIKSKKETKSGSVSVDSEVLDSIGIQFTKDLLQRRQLMKAKGTYLSQFLDAIVDNKIHANFNLHTTATYRSSMSSPNLQNLPRANQEVMKICRGGITASPGNKLLFCDYSALEFKISANVGNDPVQIAYAKDSSTCAHKDLTYKIFKLDDTTYVKALRSYTKNLMTFPLLYGSYFRNIAKNLYKACWDTEIKTGITVKEHMKANGINNYTQFETHIKKIETDFWNKFSQYKKWQEYIEKSYQIKGCTESEFGFKRVGYQSKNQLLNMPVQSAGFSCLLKAFVAVTKALKNSQFKTQLILQIHDELVLDTVPEEQEEVMKLVEYHMINAPMMGHEAFFQVPLSVEWEGTEINGAWSEKTPLINK